MILFADKIFADLIYVSGANRYDYVSGTGDFSQIFLYLAESRAKYGARNLIGNIF